VVYDVESEKQCVRDLHDVSAFLVPVPVLQEAGNFSSVARRLRDAGVRNAAGNTAQKLVDVRESAKTTNENENLNANECGATPYAGASEESRGGHENEADQDATGHWAPSSTITAEAGEANRVQRTDRAWRKNAAQKQKKKGCW
jgi:hypothetical protein